MMSHDSITVMRKFWRRQAAEDLYIFVKNGSRKGKGYEIIG